MDKFRQARIINKFQQIINLIDQRNHILTISNLSVGNGPFSMVVDSEKFSTGINVEDEISKNEFGLIIGETQFSLNNIQRWSPEPDWKAIQKQSIISFINMIETELYEAKVRDGFVEVFYGDDKLEYSKFFERMKTRSASLFEAMIQQSDGEIIAAAESLGGLGPGLTPSGDDFLIGVIYAVWALFPEEEANPITKNIWTGAAGQTTSLSRAWITSAAAGEAGEPWHNLIDAVIAQNEKKISSATSNIISIGATSGTDALCGFVQAIKLLEKR